MFDCDVLAVRTNGRAVTNGLEVAVYELDAMDMGVGDF